MAIVLTSGTRVNNAPCMHFATVVTIDGSRTINVQIDANTLNDPMTDAEAETILRVWARYQRSQGKTLAQMVGGTIFPNLP